MTLSLKQRDMILESLISKLAMYRETYYTTKSAQHRDILEVKVNDYKALIEFVRSKL
jgi:hypothetical protein